MSADFPQHIFYLYECLGAPSKLTFSLPRLIPYVNDHISHDLSLHAIHEQDLCSHSRTWFSQNHRIESTQAIGAAVVKTRVEQRVQLEVSIWTTWNGAG